MKKTIILILTIIVVIVTIITVQLKQIAQNKQDALSYNKEYEKYIGKNIYGVDVVTIINKAINSNEKNGVEKDEKGIYKENTENSIKIELNLIADVDEKTGEKKIVTRPMERIMDAGIEGFISNFNLTIFKVNKIEYHEKTGRISKIIIEQVEE